MPTFLCSSDCACLVLVLGPPRRQKQSIHFFFFLHLEIAIAKSPLEFSFQIFHFFCILKPLQQPPGRGRGEGNLSTYPCYFTLSNGAFNMYKGLKKKKIRSLILLAFVFSFSIFLFFLHFKIATSTSWTEGRKKKNYSAYVFSSIFCLEKY